MADLTPFALDKRVGNYILVGQVGSKSYNTSTPESDDDWMGIAVAPMSHYTGMKSWENDGTLKIERKETHNAELTAFELKKFLRLMTAFNPNVVPLLYLPENHYEVMTPEGAMLIANRDAFESKRAGTTLIGYADGQMNKVVNGNTGKLGEKRKDLVAKYGYDTKFASHTIRILHMADEFFRTQKLNVARYWDREMLLKIRNGQVPLKDWLDYAKFCIQQAREEEKRCTWLPDQPDYERINAMCMRIIHSTSIYDVKL